MGGTVEVHPGPGARRWRGGHEVELREAEYIQGFGLLGSDRIGWGPVPSAAPRSSAFSVPGPMLADQYSTRSRPAQGAP